MITTVLHFLTVVSTLNKQLRLYKNHGKAMKTGKCTLNIYINNKNKFEHGLVHVQTYLICRPVIVRAT